MVKECEDLIPPPELSHRGYLLQKKDGDRFVSEWPTRLNEERLKRRLVREKETAT